MPENGNGNGEKKRLVDFTGPIILDMKTFLVLGTLAASWVTTTVTLGSLKELFREQKAKQELLQYEVKQIQIMLGPNGENLKRPCGKEEL